MTYKYHLSEQIDDKILVRAMGKCRQSNTGKGAYWGYVALDSIRGILAVVGGIVVAFIAFRALGALPLTQGLFAPVSGGIIGAGVLFFAERFSRRLKVRQMMASPIYNGGTDFTFTPDGLDMRSPYVTWNVSWRAVEKVIEDKAGFFFYAGAFVYVLPKKLLSTGDAQNFLETVENWRFAERAA
ncbi:YcxB family protein [Ruegeria lacuscaerulensis]|uniref:YcxB family protein n=1 Tax=Ruegeria lacuscaerulensis TaxID=55218 RepID=UPI00147BD0D9|nr:YcxB family protein [Ruegeria lacuscaerulensis]